MNRLFVLTKIQIFCLSLLYLNEEYYAFSPKNMELVPAFPLSVRIWSPLSVGFLSHYLCHVREVALLCLPGVGGAFSSGVVASLSDKGEQVALSFGELFPSAFVG
jgi:hypothetical protein